MENMFVKTTKKVINYVIYFATVSLLNVTTEQFENIPHCQTVIHPVHPGVVLPSL
jgi:hypothetical protein